MKLLFENWRKFITEADTDNDGSLDPQELRAMADKLEDDKPSSGASFERDGNQISIDFNDVGEIVDGYDDIIDKLQDHNIFPDDIEARAKSGIPMDHFPREGEPADLVLMFKPDEVAGETPEQHARRMEEVEANLKVMLDAI